MTKKLKLPFSVEGGGTDMSVTLSSPKDALEADAIQTAASSIVTVLENASGKAAVALTGAVYITTTEDAVI